MNRRQFIETISMAALGSRSFSILPAAEAPAVQPTARRLPRWRGFNLTEKCVTGPNGSPPFAESDFAWLAEWGFDFARLPLSYLCWSSATDQCQVREGELVQLDQAVDYGRKHSVHVNLNLHRAPGYCVNPPKEPLDLWTDEAALDAAAFQWGMLARRFKGVGNAQLSFDLLNEPANVFAAAYGHVIKRLVQAIRAEDPRRLIIADGLQWGRKPVPGLVELNIAQSTRGNDPMELSHYQANWVAGATKWPIPTWPLERGGRTINAETLRRERIYPWQELERQGVGIHVGEWGAYNRTPHPVVLAWMRDQLNLWREAGWGWALWNLRGSFGMLDSGRSDVNYEEFRGHKLDREMLKVLQAG